MEQNTALAAQNNQMHELPAIIEQMMTPIMQTMTKMLEQTNTALAQLASAQQIQNDRMEALERQIRLNTLVTRQQAQYLKAAVKERVLELLEKAAVTDAKAITKLSRIIKKDVLAFYGITAVEEIPKHEYNVAMNNIQTWNNMRAVREVVKEARLREENAKED